MKRLVSVTLASLVLLFSGTAAANASTSEAGPLAKKLTSRGYTCAPSPTADWMKYRCTKGGTTVVITAFVDEGTYDIWTPQYCELSPAADFSPTAARGPWDPRRSGLDS